MFKTAFLRVSQTLMDMLSYQRTVFAFHGCNHRLHEAVLTDKKKLQGSGVKVRALQEYHK